MRLFRSLAALAFTALVLSPVACAQYGDQPIGQPLGQPWDQYGGPPPQAQYGGSGHTVTCESRDGRFSECATPFRSPPVIVNTLSSTMCIEGRNWGSRAPGTVWVNEGCRAQFAEGYGAWPDRNRGGGHGVLCESVDGRHNECRMPFRGRATLLRQHSQAACIEGRTWGSRGDGRVWVSEGCRAEFGQGRGWAPPDDGRMGAGFRCESDDGRYRECRAPTRGRHVMLRQLSQAPCIEGRSWGSRDGSVWVTEGCRAEFGTGGGWQPSPGGRTVTCESVDQRQSRCRWDARMGSPYLVEQLSSAACREGRDWGYDGRNIWVDHGCRARFGGR